MAIALVANTSEAGPNGFSTPAIDTTGADLLVAVIGHYDGIGNPTISDSKGNTWTALTASSAGEFTRNIIYYSKNPTVGSNHTVTLAGANTFAAVCWAAYSGVDTTDPFDQENGATAGGSATSIQTGSVTPTEDNELVIAGICLRDMGLTGDTASINSGFTITNQEPGVGSNNLHAAQAYLVQTTAAAVNPQWSWTNGDYVAATIATFKAAAGGGGGTAVPVFRRHYQLMQTR